MQLVPSPAPFFLSRLSPFPRVASFLSSTPSPPSFFGYLFLQYSIHSPKKTGIKRGERERVQILSEEEQKYVVHSAIKEGKYNVLTCSICSADLLSSFSTHRNFAHSLLQSSSLFFSPPQIYPCQENFFLSPLLLRGLFFFSYSSSFFATHVREPLP